MKQSDKRKIQFLSQQNLKRTLVGLSWSAGFLPVGFQMPATNRGRGKGHLHPFHKPWESFKLSWKALGIQSSNYCWVCPQQTCHALQLFCTAATRDSPPLLSVQYQTALCRPLLETGDTRQSKIIRCLMLSLLLPSHLSRLSWNKLSENPMAGLWSNSEQ